VSERIGNPIDAATEKAVEDMIRQHGLDKVKRNLDAIMHKATWGEWQRVNNLLTRTANKLRREAEKHACRTW
jgi:hypothetical protein